jgi:hypothetical protein
LLESATGASRDASVVEEASGAPALFELPQAARARSPKDKERVAGRVIGIREM